MKMNKKVLGLLGTGHAITDINQGAIAMFLAFLQPVFALSQTQVGLAMLAFNLSSSIIQPIFGVISDRIRAVWLIPLGCLLAGLGMSLTGLSFNFATLLGAALLSGLGVAAYHPEGSKFARFASGSLKGTGMSLFSVGGNIGFAAGPVLATLFYGLAGLHGSVGFLVLNGIMAMFLWVGIPTISAVEGHGAGSSARRASSGGARLEARAMVPVVLLVMVIIMRSWVHMGLVTFLPQYYVHYLHQSGAYAAAITSIFLLAGVFGTLAGGPAADRWGLKTVIIGSMAMTVPLLFLFSRLSGIWVTVAVFLAGFAVISTFSVTVVLGQEMLPNNVGLASGLMLGFGIGMGGVGTTLLGWVADHWGLPTVFEVLIIFPVLGLVMALFLPGSSALARRQGAA